MAYEINGATIEHDEEGYLVDIGDWNIDLAEMIASNEKIEMSDDAWEVVNFLRDYYEEYQVSPPVRVLAKAIRKKLGDEKGSSLHLYGLFPQGPAKQAGKIGGLPKPTKCI